MQRCSTTLSHSRFPCLNIEVNVLYDIVDPCGMKGFKARIYIIPYAVTCKDFRDLLSSQMFGILVYFHTINEKIPLATQSFLSFSSSYILNKVSMYDFNNLSPRPYYI